VNYSNKILLYVGKYIQEPNNYTIFRLTFLLNMLMNKLFLLVVPSPDN